MEIRYYGWSGVELVRDEVRIGFDLPEEAHDTWRDVDQPAALCITHGHPDHCGLLTALEERDATIGFDLVAPTVVVDRFRSLWEDSSVRVRRADHGVHGRVGPTRIERFTWDHLPLLPPDSRRAASFASRLLRHPLALLRIGWSALQLPIWSPMFGYAVEWPDGSTVVNYGEGLHGQTDDEEIEAVREAYAPEVFIAAVEPEHTDGLREGIERLGPEEVYVYEAHRPWRDQFGLPTVELDEYAAQLADTGSYTVEALER